MTAEEALARNIVNTNFEDIPAEAIRVSKKDILDTLGVAIVGSTTLGADRVVQLMKEWGGKEEATIVVYGDMVPAAHAALVNGTMTNGIDYNDWHDEALVHAGMSVVPASFAISEQKGRVTGKELITAVTLGLDLICRMGLATIMGMRGWSLSSVYGFLGAAAAASKILGLDEDGTLNALGLAYSQAAGNTQGERDGAMVVRLQAGSAARGGIIAALLAEKGYTGAMNSLEGAAGLYNVYHRGEYDATLLTDKLGEVFEGVNLSFKPWPCCRGNHAYIEAALTMTQEHDIHPEDVAEVTVFVPESLSSGGTGPHILCYPLEIRRNPRNSVDAEWSIPYTVATAITKRKVSLDDFTDEAIKDPVVLQITQKITPMLDQTLQRRGMHPGVVEIKTKNNQVFSKRVEFAYGAPENPMTLEVVADKFRDCALHAAKPLPKGNIERAIQMLSNLEEVDNVNEIIRLLT